MTDHPARPPEAELLRRARTRMNLSIREAASRVSSAMPGNHRISEGRLRQIESGYQTVSAGVRVPTSAPAKTLAYLARFYGITPESLQSEGQRPDAAEILRADAGSDAMVARAHSQYGDEPADDIAWRLFPDDEAKRWVWRASEGKPDKEREEMIAAVDRLRAGGARDGGIETETGLPAIDPGR